ncbi:hypothetical protein PUN28_008882 [Cardiocondyla obscurior]|uniref:Uncharacterized protein n=1 Tax=Cardiocondyla obscurior TaxID=286306 RepID=A0AAW2FRS2_9HYME
MTAPSHAVYLKPERWITNHLWFFYCAIIEDNTLPISFLLGGISGYVERGDDEGVRRQRKMTEPRNRNC